MVNVKFICELCQIYQAYTTKTESAKMSKLQIMLLFNIQEILNMQYVICRAVAKSDMYKLHILL